MANNEENLKNKDSEPDSSACECKGSCKENEGEPCKCKPDAAEGVKEELSELEALQAELSKARDEAKKNYDSFLRSAADLDTFRRRMQRDMEEIRKFAIQPFVEELLPVIDNLELGLVHAKKSGDVKELVVGIEMVLSQIKKVFANFGIEEINPIGKDFDPKFHECVKHEPSKGVDENKIASVMRVGYVLNGRLIRPASVIVSSKKE